MIKILTQGTHIDVTLIMRIIDLQSDRQTWRLDGLDFVVCFCSYNVLVKLAYRSKHQQHLV